MAVDWTALAGDRTEECVWSMPGWHGLRWAMMRGDGEGRTVSDVGVAMVADALACVSVEVDIAETAGAIVDYYDSRPAVQLWGMWWCPSALDVLRSVSVSGMVGSYQPSGYRTLGVLVGFGADGEPSFLLLARDAPLGEVL